jgi:hypothetical protein
MPSKTLLEKSIDRTRSDRRRRFLDGANPARRPVGAERRLAYVWSEDLSVAPFTRCESVSPVGRRRLAILPAVVGFGLQQAQMATQHLESSRLRGEADLVNKIGLTVASGGVLLDHLKACHGRRYRHNIRYFDLLAPRSKTKFYHALFASSTRRCLWRPPPMGRPTCRPIRSVVPKDSSEDQHIRA